MKQHTTTLLSLSFLLSACTQYQIGHFFFGMPSTRVHEITFDTARHAPSFQFIYPDTTGDTYLRELRTANRLDELVKPLKSDREKVLAIMNWTHRQWEHNGSNEPSKGDALTILKEARDGKQFRCVEYGVVLADALLSVGMKARVLSLKTKDAETAKSGAGHVLAEVWLADLNQWAIIDAQFNIMPMLAGKPLRAIDFQKAIVNDQPFVLMNSEGEVIGKERSHYLDFISHYLYYFDVAADERRLVKQENRHYVSGKSKVMLVPTGAKEPTTFQRKFPINYCYYTNSLAEFYQVPEEGAHKTN